jgi:hypothetical protein
MTLSQWNLWLKTNQKESLFLLTTLYFGLILIESYLIRLISLE